MSSDRRQFLAGVAAVAVAGCLGIGSDDSGTPQQENTSPDETDDDQRTVTVIVQPDPGALREAQIDVVDKLESGELEQAEAEQELAEREQALIRESIDDVSAFIEEIGATHHDTVEAEGTILVEGTPAEIMDILTAPLVSAILNRERFELAKEREQQGEAGPDGELPEDESETENGE